MMRARCRNCLLPAAVPGANLNRDSLCAFCTESNSDEEARSEAARRRYEVDLETTLRNPPRTGQYDALVCLSGGKDSLYLLHRLIVDYRLRVLAFTTDVNLPELAWKNIRRAVEKLGCDHLVYRPPDHFYRKLFAHLLRNQEDRGAVYTVSYVYAPLFEGDALRCATEKRIPIVCAGYSPGQPEPERMVYEFPRSLVESTSWVPPALKSSGRFSDDELARFWDPASFPPGTQFPRYLAPFHAWPYDQDRVMRAVYDHDLVQRRSHASPVYSNYPVNWLLMYSDLLHFGYNPYAPEFCALIRKGKASRLYWSFMAPLVDRMVRHKVLLGRTTKQQMSWLGLTEGDLAIKLPKGAYDPPL